MNNSVVLIGPMGAGKTTLGKKLARQLGVPFADTDKIVSAKHGSVQSIFQKHGEEHFRDLETLALKKALESAGIVATGGGLPLRQANRKLLEGNLVIFLDTSQEHVIGKINLNKRPLLRTIRIAGLKSTMSEGRFMSRFHSAQYSPVGNH